MALIDDVKISLRITSTAYNTEITDLISAAKADIALGGVITTSEDNALYKMAVILYVKANFGYDNADADRLNQSYDSLKQKLMLAIGDSYYTVTFNLAGGQNVVNFNGYDGETDDDGAVIFYSRAGNHLPYTVGSGSECYVDISENTVVEVS